MNSCLLALLAFLLPAPALALRLTEEFPDGWVVAPPAASNVAAASNRRLRIQGYTFGDGDGFVDSETESALDGVSKSSVHVVLETPKPGATGLRAMIQNNSMGSFLRPRVIFVSFDDNVDIERSPNGVPVLRSMFNSAIQAFPKADTYTYFNSDIAVDRSFIATADAVAKAVKDQVLRKRFLVVGRRTNVNWTSSEEEVRSGQASDALLKEELPKGELFRPDAEDYFMVSSQSFHWPKLPAFIVGHRGFDNWLVSKASSDPDMDAVDATNTLRAMHMTDRNIGNKEGFKPSSDGVDYNMKFFRKGELNWRCALSTSVEWATQKGAEGQIKFARRKVDPLCKPSLM